MRSKVVAEDRFGPVAQVAGADVAYDLGDGEGCAAVAVLAFPALGRVACAQVRVRAPVPYRSGFLGFREAPGILEALSGLPALPDLLLVEGHGTAHPRRFGSACHVGVLADLPTVGVAKRGFVGSHRPVGEGRGTWAPVTDGGEVVGATVRTRAGVRPVYVSPGHRVGLEAAVAFVLACSPRYRMPEPLRAAHRLAEEGLRRSPPGGSR